MNPRSVTCKFVVISNFAMLCKLFVKAESSSSSDSDELMACSSGKTSKSGNCFLDRSGMGFGEFSRMQHRSDPCRSSMTNPVIACYGRPGPASSNKIKEKVYKIQKLAANSHENTGKVVLTQLDEILSSIKGLVDTSDVRIASLISENLKKLERMLSRSVEDSISGIGNNTQKAIKKHNASLLEKQQSLISETSAEAQKYVESIIAIQDPKKVSEVVNDKMNGLLPNITRYFANVSLLNIPMFSDSVNEETKEIQDLIGEEMRSNGEKISASASEVEAGLLKILSKSSNSRNNSIKELMLKKTRYIVYQIQQVLSSLEDEINELVYTVSPHSRNPAEVYNRRRSGLESVLGFDFS